MRSRTRIGFLGGMGLGAALMYTLDPAHGRRRRAVILDKLGRFTPEPERGRGSAVSDKVLEDRVRAALGRAVSHPRAIHVEVTDGCVCLTGQVLERETRELLRRVGRVAGVTAVDDRLERHPSGAGVPALQGGRVPIHGLERDIWPPGWRLVAGAGGLGLGVVGLSRGGILGGAITLGGGALITRALSNRPVFASARGRMIEQRKTFIIQAPIDEVYRFWTHVGNFPRFMEHVKQVTINKDNPRRSHWEVRGPGGLTMKWDAEVTRTMPNECFSWKTLPGSSVEHAGMVEFEEVGPDTTRVHVQMSYNPPAGALGHAVASLFGADPKSRMDEDLVRFKALLEDGRTRAHGHSVTIKDVRPGIY
jgi:uncharacterized membrane protein